MGDIKNLSDSEAVAKLKELAEDKICLFCTYDNGQLVSRPMGTQKVDEDGTIWFISNKESTKNMQLMHDSRVYLVYSDSSKNHYLSLSGFGQILTDRNKLDELWNPIAKAWFEEGKDDPDISLIKVHPEEGHYWDTKNGKLISMIKIAVSALTGAHSDGGVEGDLQL